MVALDTEKLGWAPGAETGSRGGGRRLVCEAHGREESQQRAQASGELAHGTTRRVERSSSVCVQGDGAAWRDRDASGEARDGEAARARCVAVPAARRQRRERETEKGDGGGAIS